MTHEDLQRQLSVGEDAEVHGNYDEAERLSQEVLMALSSPQATAEAGAESSRLQASATRLLGRVSWRRGDYQQALELLQSALQASLEINDQSGISKVLSNIGIVHYHLSDYPKALEYYNRALSLAEELGDKSGISGILGNIGLVHGVLSDYSKALEFYHRALRLDEELGNTLGIARHLGHIGSVHSNLSNYSKALEYFGKTLSLVEELGNTYGVAIQLGNIGTVHYLLSDYPKAIAYHSKALRIDEELGNMSGVSRHLGHIGNVYRSLSDYAKALEYYNKALAIDKKLGYKRGISVNLGNIGTLHSDRSDYAMSLEYYGESLSISEMLGNKSVVAMALYNIGNVYLNLGDYSQAQEYLHRGLSLYVELGEKSKVGEMKALLGALFATDGNPNHDESKAEAFLLDSIAASEELGTKKYEAHKALAELYEKQERWKESHYHIVQYLKLKEEVQSEEARKSAALVEQRREIAERDKQLSVERAEARATQTVLHQVLPASIASRLIKGEKVADYFQNVSILFADIVGFTPIASRMPAKAVLTFLNYVFGEFDRMAAACGCEKIKTIGDGYLAVAGAPDTCEDHAERIARLAIEMSNDIILPEDIRKTLPKGAQFNLRIGIHTGPIFGGIVGENRFVYDIYSDAVNLAARMESHGLPGKIHVSDEYCFHLQNRMDASGNDLGGIRFEEREEMEIKGKGMMRTYFLEKA